MQSSAWIMLLRRIPETHHDNLTLTTANGMEISLQTIMRLEKDYIVLRGRIGGTTDMGKILIVPYDQITYMAFTRTISEAEIRAIHGEGETPTVTLDAKSDTDIIPVPHGLAPEPAKPGAAASPPPPQTPGGTPVPLPSRPNLADRLRSRSIPPPPKPPGK